MTVNINTTLDLNITDFLLLQEISEMKLNRVIGVDQNNNEIHFYDNYKSSILASNDIKNQFYVSVGAQNNLNNDNSNSYIGGAGAYTKISQTQADYFLDNFKILDYYGNDNTGFSATTFIKNSDIALVNGENKLEEITISFRSTEFKEDYYKDAYGADTEINDSGTAIAQNIALVNYLEKLKSNGIITANTRINITGYSLGGHLASSAYQYLKYDNYDIKKLYVFNGPGVGNVLNPGTLDHTVTTNNFGLLKDDLLNYSKILDMFQSLATQNITTKQDSLTFINLNSTYQIVYDFFYNMDKDLLETTLFLNHNGSLLKTSGLSIYNSDNSYLENENEISRDINIQNNDDSAYLSNTIYNSVIYKKFKDFIINKYGMTKASTGGNTFTNTATEEQTLIVASQSEKTGVYSPNLFGDNTLWINGQSSINNFDYLSNDFNFVANSNRYGENVSLIIEDRPETEDELARVPIAESFTKTLNGDFGNTHSITLLNKTLNLMATLAKLEGKSFINAAKYSALISSSSKERASHFYSKSDGNVGTGDYNAVANIINTLSNILLASKGKPQVMFDNTLGGWANIDKLNLLDEIESELVNTHISNLNFISLYNIKSSDMSRTDFNITQYDYISKAELITKSKSNIAYRYALDYLNTFVIDGFDYSNYSNSIDTIHSDEWYSSRADILLKIIDSNVANLNNYTSSGYNDTEITGNSNIYVNDKKQDIAFLSNNFNYNLPNTVYNTNSYYAQSQSFNKVSSLDSGILRTINKIIANKATTFGGTALGVLGAAGTAGLVILVPGIGVGALGVLTGLGISTVINNSINFNSVYLPSNSGSDSIAVANYFNKNFRGSDLQKYIDNLNYRNSLSIDKNIYFLDNYISNYNTDNYKNKNENVFINVNKNLLFNFLQNPSINPVFNNTFYNLKEGVTTAQSINDIILKHTVHLGDGNDYLEIDDDGESNIYSTSGKKNYYLKGAKTYITDHDKTGTITLDGILLNGGDMYVDENGITDPKKRVQTFYSTDSLDVNGNPIAFKIMYELSKFNPLTGETYNYSITNEKTGHIIIINDMNNFGNGSVFNFKKLTTNIVDNSRTIKDSDYNNSNVYSSNNNYTCRIIENTYSSSTDFTALFNININIANENMVLTRDPNNQKDLFIYDKTNPNTMYTIADFFWPNGDIRNYNYDIVFPDGHIEERNSGFEINNTSLYNLLQYNPTLSTPGLDTMDSINQALGYSAYEIIPSFEKTMHYSPFAKYYLDNSIVASTGFKKEGNDLLIFSLSYKQSGNTTIKNYFSFDHTNSTNFYIHRYGDNISLSPSELTQRIATRLDENSSNYVMDANSYKTVVSGFGDDVVVGTSADETFISGTVIDYPEMNSVGYGYADGNDNFTGGGGSDIYSFSGNFGYDTITDFNNSSMIYIDNTSQLVDYQFLKNGNDLIVYKPFEETTQEIHSQLTIKNYFINIDYINNSRIILTRNYQHYDQLYSDPTYTPETYYNFTSSDIQAFNHIDLSKSNETTLEQTAKDNSNNNIDTDKITGSSITGNDLDNLIIIRNNDTVIHSNDSSELTDGNDTYIVDIGVNEAIPQMHNAYRTTIEFGFNSGHDTLLNPLFKPNSQYGDIIDLKNIDSNNLIVNSIKNDLGVVTSLNLILQDGSSILVAIVPDTYSNAEVVKTVDDVLTLNDLITLSNNNMIVGDSMNNSFDLSQTLKSVNINGLDGNDFIIGSKSDDTIEGGKGFDKFQFTGGYDTYKFNSNSDIDTFDMTTLKSEDILNISAKFLIDSSYKANGISYAYSANDEEGYLKLSQSDGVVFSNVSWSNFVLLINNINVEFTDGTTPDMNIDYTNGFPFVQSVKVANGTSGTDYLQTNPVYSNLIYGKDGNDTIVSSGNGEHTRNFLIGGKGSDTITANNGDLVIVKDGDGADTIKTNDRSFVLEILHNTPRLINNKETLFDVSAISNSSNDLKLKYGGASDTITIKNYFAVNDTEITVALFDNTNNNTVVYENLSTILSNMGLTKSYLLGHGATTVYKNTTNADLTSPTGQLVGGEIAYQYLNGTYLQDQNKINHIIDNQVNGQPFQNKVYS